MNKFDRNRQKALLQELFDAYPKELPDDRIDYFKEEFENPDVLAANLIYLQNHGMIKGAVKKMASGDYQTMLFNAEITEKGLDYVQVDGGLTAELGVQVVKIHKSTITALEDILLLSNLPADKKTGLIAKLRELPPDAIRHLTLQLLTRATLNPQAALNVVQTALHSL